MICGLVSKCDAEAMVEGTKIINCTRCGEEIFCSPASQDLLADESKNILPHCTSCGDELIKEIRETGQRPEYRMAPGASQEFSFAQWWRLCHAT